MSGWAKRDLQAPGEERVSSWLGRVPGYSGYKRKEARRDEDKRVREELAREYGEYARRLAALQGELARARRVTEIAAIERLERALRLFADRLRTATYGYGALFSDRVVDERALDQLQAFDRALGDGLAEVGTGVAALEGAVSGGDLTGPARQLQTTIDALSRRFDARGQVVQTGQAQEGPAVAALFAAPGERQAHVASDLHFGDAVSISGADYLVQGRMEFHAGDDAWRQYLLRDVETERWLHVPPDTGEPMALLAVAASPPAEGEQVTLDGTTYRQAGAGEAAAEVVGEGGQATGRRARYRRYGGPAGALLFIYDWGGGERQALAGRALDPLEVNVYPKA